MVQNMSTTQSDLEFITSFLEKSEAVDEKCKAYCKAEESLERKISSLKQISEQAPPKYSDDFLQSIKSKLIPKAVARFVFFFLVCVGGGITVSSGF